VFWEWRVREEGGAGDGAGEGAGDGVALPVASKSWSVPFPLAGAFIVGAGDSEAEIELEGLGALGLFFLRRPPNFPGCFFVDVGFCVTAALLLAVSSSDAASLLAVFGARAVACLLLASLPSRWVLTGVEVFVVARGCNDGEDMGSRASSSSSVLDTDELRTLSIAAGLDVGLDSVEGEGVGVDDGDLPFGGFLPSRAIWAGKGDLSLTRGSTLISSSSEGITEAVEAIEVLRVGCDVLAAVLFCLCALLEELRLP
jgi:hypothetical protein